jgi:hypothetical protein
MSTITKNRRALTLLATAGAAAGIAAIVAPTTAVAAGNQPSLNNGEWRLAPAAAGAQAATPKAVAAPNALSTCTGWSDFVNGFGEVVHIPSIGQGDGQVTCGLGQGNANNAVFKLQTALNRCYGNNLTVDGNFGPLTADALRKAQQKESISADAQYGPQTRDHLSWPIFESDGTFSRCAKFNF